MDAAHLDQPNSDIWLGFASIAEQYGYEDTARAMYGRVEAPKVNYPGSSYSIAQKRLGALHTAATR